MSRLLGQRWRSRTFFCSSEKNDSIRALSAHAPALLVDHVRPWWRSVSTKRRDGNWDRDRSGLRFLPDVVTAPHSPVLPPPCERRLVDSPLAYKFFLRFLELVVKVSPVASLFGSVDGQQPGFGRNAAVTLASLGSHYLYVAFTDAGGAGMANLRVLKELQEQLLANGLDSLADAARGLGIRDGLNVVKGPDDAI